jgi:integrase
LARQAAVALTGRDGDDDPVAEELLADLSSIFHDPETVLDDKPKNLLTTAHVTALLVALDSKPWATYNTKTGKTTDPTPARAVALNLRREDVGSTFAVIVHSKTGKPRRVPLSSELRADLLARCHPSAFVFGQDEKKGKSPTPAAVSVAFARLARALALPGLSHHTDRPHRHQHSGRMCQRVRRVLSPQRRSSRPPSSLTSQRSRSVKRSGFPCRSN